MKPFSYLVQFRADVLADRHREIVNVLSAMKGSGITLFPSVVGLENFSGRELQVLNRGYTPGTVTRAIVSLISLKEMFPAELDLSETVASFILFNPYTRFQDLKINLDKMKITDFSLFKDININRVRINPDTALYELARLDGLTIEKQDDRSLADLPRGGYQADFPYRFKDRRVAMVCESYLAGEKMKLNGTTERTLYVLEKIVNSF